MRYFFLVLILTGVAVVGTFGFRGHKFTQPPIEVFNDMDHQAKVKAQAESEFFADGLGARMPVPNTLPVGYSLPEKPFHDGGRAEGPEFSMSLPEYAWETGKPLGYYEGSGSYYYTGRMGEYYGSGMPEEIEMDTSFLEEGREQYTIYCAICHGDSGNGNGVVRQYLTSLVANLHEPRFADPTNPEYRPDGEIYEVITIGRGQMGPYGMSIPVRERWAIVAYLRALQDAKKNADAADNAANETAQQSEGQNPAS
ncbi:MAG: cytochrome c [Verrucomicrobiota bacterium]